MLWRYHDIACVSITIAADAPALNGIRPSADTAGCKVTQMLCELALSIGDSEPLIWGDDVIKKANNL